MNFKQKLATHLNFLNDFWIISIAISQGPSKIYILILHFIQSILTTVKKERKKDRCITEDYPTNKIALSSFKAN